MKNTLIVVLDDILGEKLLQKKILADFLVDCMGRPYRPKEKTVSRAYSIRVFHIAQRAYQERSTRLVFATMAHPLPLEYLSAARYLVLNTEIAEVFMFSARTPGIAENFPRSVVLYKIDVSGLHATIKNGSVLKS